MKLPCGVGAEAECTGLQSEAAVALIQEKQRTVGAQHHQILQAGIAEIHEQRAGCRIENTDAGAIRNVFQRPIAPIAIEPIGKTARLAHVDLVPAVAVDISHRDTVVAVHVDSRRRIQTRPPVRDPVRELLIERADPSERNAQ